MMDKERLDELEESIKLLSSDELTKERYLTEDGISIKINREGRRMKAYVKFDKDETEGWLTFYENFCPSEDSGRKVFTESDLMKKCIMEGMQSIMVKVREMVQQAKEEAELAEDDIEEAVENSEEITVL